MNNKFLVFVIIALNCEHNEEDQKEKKKKRFEKKTKIKMMKNNYK